MALIGVALQAFAGIVYGFSYLVGVERIDKWKESRKAWLSDSKNRIKLSYLLVFITPLPFAIHAHKVTGDVNTPWYAAVLGLTVSWGAIVLIYTSFLLIWSKSKSIADMLESPKVNQMMQKGNIASIIVGIVLMVLGAAAIIRLGEQATTPTTIISIIVLSIALTALFFGLVLLTMPGLYYVLYLFVSGAGLLFKPGKAVWILALCLYLAGCGLLITNEIYSAG